MELPKEAYPPDTKIAPNCEEPNLSGSTSPEKSNLAGGSDAGDELLKLFTSQLSGAVGLVDKMSPYQRDKALGQLHSMLQQKELLSPDPTKHELKVPATASDSRSDSTPQVAKRGRGRPPKKTTNVNRFGKTYSKGKDATFIEPCTPITEDEGEQSSRKSSRVRKPSTKIRNIDDEEMTGSDEFPESSTNADEKSGVSFVGNVTRKRGRPPKKRLDEGKERTTQSQEYIDVVVMKEGSMKLFQKHEITTKKPKQVVAPDDIGTGVVFHIENKPSQMMQRKGKSANSTESNVQHSNSTTSDVTFRSIKYEKEPHDDKQQLAESCKEASEDASLTTPTLLCHACCQTFYEHSEFTSHQCHVTEMDIKPVVSCEPPLSTENEVSKDDGKRPNEAMKFEAKQENSTDRTSDASQVIIIKQSAKSEQPIKVKTDKGKSDVQLELYDDLNSFIKKVDGNYKCTICGKEAPLRSNLVSHLRSHTGAKPYPCSMCSKWFKTSSNRQRHIRETHEKHRPKTCEVCGKGFFTQASLNNHIQKAHSSDQEDEKRAKPFKCKECGKEYSRKAGLKTHMTMHSDAEFHTCLHCDKTFRFIANLRRHMKIHNDERPHQCPHCDKCFIEPRSLKRHQLIKHEGIRLEQTPKFFCEHCNKGYACQSSLAIHEMSHSGAKPHLCGVCGRSFSLKTNLKRHMATHTSDRPFPCPQCPKRYASKRNLAAHLMAHNDDTPFVCNVCGKGFTNRNTLKEHMPTHHRNRAFSCTECKQTFLRQSHLKFHMRRHNSDPQATCEHCNAKFYRKTDLRRHLLKHTGEKPFKCMLCPRAFSRQHYLKDHLKSHTSLYIRCSACDKVYAGALPYHQHITSEHKELMNKDKRPIILLPANTLQQNNQPIDIKINIKKDITPQAMMLCEKLGEHSLLQVKSHDPRSILAGSTVYTKVQQVPQPRAQGAKDPLHQAMSVIFDSEEEFTQKVQIAQPDVASTKQVTIEEIEGNITKYYDPNTLEEVIIHKESAPSAAETTSQLINILTSPDNLGNSSIVQYTVQPEEESGHKAQATTTLPGLLKQDPQNIGDDEHFVPSETLDIHDSTGAVESMDVDPGPSGINTMTQDGLVLPQGNQDELIPQLKDSIESAIEPDSKSGIPDDIPQDMTEVCSPNGEQLATNDDISHLSSNQEASQMILGNTEQLATSNAEPAIIETVGEDGERQHFVLMPDGSQVPLTLEPNSTTSGPREIKVVIEGQEEPQYLFIVNE